MGSDPIVVVIDLIESLNIVQLVHGPTEMWSRPNRNVVQLNHGYTGRQANGLAITQSNWTMPTQADRPTVHISMII